MSTRILITGATGFVGSHILESLMQDRQVIPIAACRSPENLSPDFKGEVRIGDLRDPQYIHSVTQNIDIICHAAAWSSLFAHKRQSRTNFLEPSLRLIQSAQNAGVKKFIFTSSTSATSPKYSTNALHKGVPKRFWPHLSSVVAIEDNLREVANSEFSTIILRLGIFTGRRYRLGLIPILLPRLRTHLVPWVKGGKTHLPLIDGRDIGQAFLKTAKTELPSHDAFNIIGAEQPTVRSLITFIHQNFGYPKPHFSVPFFVAYPFAWLMEKLNPVVPWEPLVTRSIIYLMEENKITNDKAQSQLGYEPTIQWQDSVREQIHELHQHQGKSMSMSSNKRDKLNATQ